MEDEYNIPMPRTFKEEVGAMCNLSERIEEKGIQKGLIQSVKSLLENGIPADEVKHLLNVTDEEIRLAKKYIMSDHEERGGDFAVSLFFSQC